MKTTRIVATCGRCGKEINPEIQSNYSCGCIIANIKQLAKTSKKEGRLYTGISG